MPVEWLVLADSRAPETQPRFHGSTAKNCLFLVPIDDNPSFGSLDQALDNHENTHLRGACGAWVSPEVLAGSLFTGRLGKEQLQKAQKIQEEPPRASSEQQEMDADPEYQAWLQALCTDAARLGKGSAANAEIIRPPAFQKRRRPAHWLAIAAALLAAAGLPFLLRLESPKAPFLVPFSDSHQVSVGDVTRGVDDSILEIVAGQELVVTISLWRIEQQPSYRMEILQGGAVKWSSDRVAAQDDFLLILPEGWLPAGYYHLRIYGIGKDGVERLLKESPSSLGSW
jgi:hypothetical protein